METLVKELGINITVIPAQHIFNILIRLMRFQRMIPTLSTPWA